jgi:hypothetical protein
LDNITYIDFDTAFTIASVFIVAVAPLSIMFAVLQKALNLFISFVIGGKLEL